MLLRRCQNSNGTERWPEIKDILLRLPERLALVRSPASTDQNGSQRPSGISPSRKKTLKRTFRYILTNYGIF